MFLRRLNCLFWGHTWFPTVLEHRNVYVPEFDPKKVGLAAIGARMDRQEFKWLYCTACGETMSNPQRIIEKNLDPLHEAGGRLPDPEFHPMPGDW